MSIQNLQEALGEADQAKDLATILPDVLKQNVTDENTTDVPQITIAKKKSICGVCSSKESPYKCSICYLSYCSLACSNIHKSTHPLSSRNSTRPKTCKVSDIPKRLCGLERKEAFAPLDESKDLQKLFKLYPNLPNVLSKIHEATLPPTNLPHPILPLGRPRRTKKEPPWTSDVGLQNGVKALHAAINTGDLDGEGVRAYTHLVLKIVRGSSDRITEQNAADQIRRELVEHDKRMIEKLLGG